MILCPVRNPRSFLRPRIFQRFGENKEAYSKYGNTNGHSGIDFALEVDTPLYAPFDGIVTVSPAWDEHSNYGWYIRIKNDRLECILAHLYAVVWPDKTFVRMGEKVAYSGGAKGTIGAGNSSYPHLHFGVRHLKEDGTPMYPDNQNHAWEDVEQYIICWFKTLA